MDFVNEASRLRWDEVGPVQNRRGSPGAAFARRWIVLSLMGRAKFAIL